MNHSWKDNTCIHCGVKREKRKQRIVTTILLRKAYYKTLRSWYYGPMAGFKRPNCKK